MRESNLYEFTKLIASIGALFFKEGLRLKDGRPSPYFLNMGQFNNGELIAKLGSYYADYLYQNNLVNSKDCLIGPSYKGISLVLSTAIFLYQKYDLNIDFDYDRSEIKSHGEGSKDSRFFVTGGLKIKDIDQKVIIIDDVISSAKTKVDIIDKVKDYVYDNNEKSMVNYKDKFKFVLIAVDRQMPLPNKESEGITAINEFEKIIGINVYSLFNIIDIYVCLLNNKIPVSQEIGGKVEFRPLTDYWKEKVDYYHTQYNIGGLK